MIPFELAYSSFAEKYARMYVSWQCWQLVLSPPVVPFSGACSFYVSVSLFCLPIVLCLVETYTATQQ